MAYHATGIARRNDAPTRIKKFFVSRKTIFLTEAPNTFLMPISFVRWSDEKAARPNSPIDTIRIESIARTGTLIALRLYRRIRPLAKILNVLAEKRTQWLLLITLRVRPCTVVPMVHCNNKAYIHLILRERINPGVFALINVGLSTEIIL
jgi:hypothetical protein